MAAAPMFPGAGPFAGPSALDGPPPSPTPMGAGMDASGAFSMRGLAPQGPGSIPGSSMPPEVLTGITQSAQTMYGLLDGFAQITPDQAGHLALIKDMLQQYLANVMASGGG